MKKTKQESIKEISKVLQSLIKYIEKADLECDEKNLLRGVEKVEDCN